MSRPVWLVKRNFSRKARGKYIVRPMSTVCPIIATSFCVMEKAPCIWAKAVKYIPFENWNEHRNSRYKTTLAQSGTQSRKFISLGFSLLQAISGALCRLHSCLKPNAQQALE